MRIDCWLTFWVQRLRPFGRRINQSCSPKISCFDRLAGRHAGDGKMRYVIKGEGASSSDASFQCKHSRSLSIPWHEVLTKNKSFSQKQGAANFTTHNPSTVGYPPDTNYGLERYALLSAHAMCPSLSTVSGSGLKVDVM